MDVNPRIDIVIKSYNEEANIENCILSCLDIRDRYSGKTILIDGLSEDRTIEHAKKYSIEIYQVIDKQNRTCGLAGHLAKFLCIDSDYILLIDGDMILQKDAVDVIINEFQLDERYAGITGYIQDIDPTANILSKIYAMHCAEKKPQEMKSLPGVGIYNTQFIRDKDCFMNPFLKDYEEQELGFRILANNGILKRINVVIVKHNRHMGNSLSVMFRKFRLGYFRGRGQALRFSLKQDINIFLKHMSFLKLYIFLIFWWSLTIITILMNQISFLKIFFAFSGIILFIYILFKKNIAIALHQIISWHLFAIGIIIGFFMGCKSPNSIHIDVVKKIQ